MTSNFLLLIAIGINSSSAFALNPASETAVKDIQDQIYAANKMDKKIGDAETLLQRAEMDKKPEIVLRPLKDAVSREKAKKFAALTKAIHMTIEAYDLEPLNPTGTSVMKSTKDRKLTWLPIAREMEAHVIERLNGARNEIEQPKDEIVGITYADGTTFMDPSAFLHGPGYLASYLLHERTHFEQITTDGKANKLTYAALQEEAYQAQVDNAAIFFNPKTQLRLMQDIERLRDEQTQIVQQEIKESKTIKGRIRALIPRPRVDLFESKAHSNEELADITALVQKARSQAEIARRDREDRERHARRALYQRLQSAYLDIAKKSCESPGSVSQAELDALPSSRDMEDRSTPEGLNDCETKSYQGLMDGANANDLVRYATPVVPATPSITYPPLPQPPVTYVPAVARKSLGEILPGLKEFAEMACKYGGHIPAPKSFFAPPQPYAVLLFDDAAAEKLKAGLGRCEGHVFSRLYKALRDGRGDLVTEQWFVDAVAATPAEIIPPANNGGYFPPPQNGGGGRNPCEVNGDPFGCQPRR